VKRNGDGDIMYYTAEQYLPIPSVLPNRYGPIRGTLVEEADADVDADIE
jgi:hypothetical protein